MDFRKLACAASLFAITASHASAEPKYLAVEKAFTYACTQDGKFTEQTIKKTVETLATQYEYPFEFTPDGQGRQGKTWFMVDPVGDDNLHIRYEEATTENGKKFRKCTAIILKDTFATADLYIKTRFNPLKISEENTGRLRTIYYGMEIPGIDGSKEILRMAVYDAADGIFTELELNYFLD